MRLFTRHGERGSWTMRGIAAVRGPRRHVSRARARSENSNGEPLAGGSEAAHAISFDRSPRRHAQPTPPPPRALEPEAESSPLVLVALHDEGAILRLVREELASQGFRVEAVSSAREALRVALQQQPSIVLLDVALPDASGMDVMRELQGRTNVPVILLSPRDDRAERVRGLDMGADDVVVKPFSAEELSARVRAVLRRSRSTNRRGRLLRMDGVEVDLERRVVTRHGAPVKLTRTEWMLLEHLIANAGHVLMNADLLKRVWGPEYTGDLQYLRVWISRLRHKLETNPSHPRFIKTYAGIGYMLDLRGTAPAA